MTTPPFDPEIAHALATRDDVVTALLPAEIAGLRARAVRPDAAAITREGRMLLTEHVAARADGGEVAVVVLRPAGVDHDVPVLYFVHGGGLVVGTPFDDLPALAQMALEVGMAIVAVDYRLAPEHPYPLPLDDVLAGLDWLVAHASPLGLDAARIVLGGVSAGGGLAAAAALRLRDEGGPAVRGQLLLCPMLDDRNDSASARQMAGLGAWDRRANETGWSAYLGDIRGEVPVYASPGRATDLSGLPPTFLDVGSAETFRDEIVAYAELLWACGGDAELHVWAGGVHGFDALAPEAALSRAARAARTDWLRRLLARP